MTRQDIGDQVALWNGKFSRAVKIVDVVMREFPVVVVDRSQRERRSSNCTEGPTEEPK